jgi:tungstate transport system substrate-binding protein
MIDRRHFLMLGGVAAVGCTKGQEKASEKPAASAPLAKPADAKIVRVGSVQTAVEGNVLPAMAAEFEKSSSVKVAISAHEDPYGPARKGEVDIVVSHYGHHEAETFVMDGLGEWPRTLFANQMALVGPPSDPAKIRGLTDLGEAFKRIAEKKNPFVVIDTDGGRYLTELVWNAAGRPDRAGWVIETETDEAGQHGKGKALRLASERGAYAFCGLTPFLRNKAKSALDLEPLVMNDPLLLRLMVSIVVRSDKIAGANVDGARAFQSFLLSPATQARIRALPYPGERVCWVPSGRDNRAAILPKT